MTYQEMLKLLAEKRSAYGALSKQIGITKPTDEQRSALDAIRGDIEGLQEAIVREEEQRSTDAVLAGQMNEDAAEGKKKNGVEKRHAVMNAYLCRGFNGMTAEERLAITEQRALSTSPTEGGYTIDTETLAKVVMPKLSYGAALNQANVLNTGKGNPMNWAVSAEGAVKGIIVGEAQNHGKRDTKFTNVQLGAYKISSQIILISEELLQDSEIDMVSYITAIARQRIDRGMDSYIINGTGEAQPKGLLNWITKAVEIDDWTKFSWETLVDMIHDVDPAYRTSPKVAFGMHDKTLGRMRKTKNANGDPIYSRDLTSPMPDRILGYGVVIDNEFPEIENKVGKGGVVFGDWNAFIVRRVNGLTVKRLDELYAETGQVGFLAFERFDCVLEDLAAFTQLSIKGVKAAAGGA